jgi:cyclopropane-fatty-acyl-phospholipid synthase
MLDYRDVNKKYNAVASIEMIEAVGQNYLPSYFKKIKDSLSEGGIAAIQAITIDDKIYDRYKLKTDFIQKYIFPGGFLPSKKEILKLSNQNGLYFDKCNSYGLDYSNTLRIWRSEFAKKWNSISQQGFDDTFKRMWNFYLSYCEAGFKAKNIDLIQFSMNKN